VDSYGDAKVRMQKAVAIIPARYGSTRFPGKALKELKGKAVILHVVEKALSCKTISDVIVATDDKRIFDAVTSAGFNARMTSDKHKSGTDRIAEVAEKLDAEIIVNIQGDEPMINPASVDSAVSALLEDESLNVATLAVVISEEEFENPHAVKVVTDKNGMALYFSRSPIPFKRGKINNREMKKHLGLYAYRRKFLLEYAVLSPTKLEMAEELEQLRILENGIGIKVIKTNKDSIGIDTPEDLERAEELA